MTGYPDPTSTGGGGSQDDGGGRRPRSSCRWGGLARRARPACGSPQRGGDARWEGGRLREEEASLHERLVDRDQSALLECLDRFGHIVYSTSLTETGDSVVAEAVTERVFVQLWRRPEAFHPRRGPLLLQLVRATLRPASA